MTQIYGPVPLRAVTIQYLPAGTGPSALTYVWFYQQVRGHGPWDYKQRGRQFESFGNFHYGAVGHAAGIIDEVLLRGAGWAQSRAGTTDPAFGDWYGSTPYGDDPNDQTPLIETGIAHAMFTT